MLKRDGLDYRLVNVSLVALTIFFIYRTGNLWIDTVNKTISIITPFVLSFALAYAVSPIVERLRGKGIPKGLAVLIVLFATLGLIIFVGYIITSMLVGQLSDLFSGINNFLSEISTKDWNINISGLQSTISENFQEIITDITKYVSNGAINLIGTSLNFIGKVFIGFAAYIYFLIDMGKIRAMIKKYFRKKGKKTYRFVKILDNEMKNYLSGLVQVMIISVFEYAIVYAIIGHPNAILLGFLAGVANLIPYFGGIGCNCIAAITAFVVSPGLFVRTLIAFFILSSVDSYVINPAVYGKTNSIHPLITIFAMFAGGAIFGIIGIFIAFPVAIIIAATYKYYKDDISDSIDKIRENNKAENEA
jgi:Predicted permease